MLGTGVLASIFNTLFLPLPGVWQFGVHLATTLVFLHTHNARVCRDLLRQHSNGCNKLTDSWPKVELLGQTFAGLVGLIIVPKELTVLQLQQQCQVTVAFVQCLFGLDRILEPFLDELPLFNKTCALSAISLQLVGVLWFLSFKFFSQV
eukprot:gene8855-9034_t